MLLFPKNEITHHSAIPKKSESRSVCDSKSARVQSFEDREVEARGRGEARVRVPGPDRAEERAPVSDDSDPAREESRVWARGWEGAPR